MFQDYPLLNGNNERPEVSKQSNANVSFSENFAYVLNERSLVLIKFHEILVTTKQSNK